MSLIHRCDVCGQTAGRTHGPGTPRQCRYVNTEKILVEHMGFSTPKLSMGFSLFAKESDTGEEIPAHLCGACFATALKICTEEMLRNLSGHGEAPRETFDAIKHTLPDVGPADVKTFHEGAE